MSLGALWWLVSPPINRLVFSHTPLGLKVMLCISSERGRDHIVFARSTDLSTLCWSASKWQSVLGMEHHCRNGCYEVLSSLFQGLGWGYHDWSSTIPGSHYCQSLMSLLHCKWWPCCTQCIWRVHKVDSLNLNLNFINFVTLFYCFSIDHWYFYKCRFIFYGPVHEI